MTTQHHHVRLTFRPIPVLCVVAAFLVAASPAVANTYTGRAFSAAVSAPTAGVGPLYLADTGPLSEAGGWEGAGSMSETVPALLSVSVLNAATVGADGQTTSSASLADVVAFAGQPAELRASFVMAEASAGATGATAVTEVDDLTLGGIAVTVTGLPNQVVSLPGVATLIINEQTLSADGTSAVLNALRLTLVSGDEVTLASARSQAAADVQLTGLSLPYQGASRKRGTALPLWRPGIVPAHVGGEDQCIDFVTGGGHFEPPNSNRPGRVNFGFNAGPRSLQNQTLRGHWNHIDHGDGTHVSGTTVDNYFKFGGDPDHCRIIEGDARFNGMAGFRYWAGVCDYGEPGRDDRYILRVTLAGAEVYFVDNHDGTPSPFGGELDGGNIQLHKSKCP